MIDKLDLRKLKNGATFIQGNLGFRVEACRKVKGKVYCRSLTIEELADSSMISFKKDEYFIR